MEAPDASSMASSAIASKRMWALSAHDDVNCFASPSALSRALCAPADSLMSAMSGALSAMADVKFFSSMSAMQMWHDVPSPTDVYFSL